MEAPPPNEPVEELEEEAVDDDAGDDDAGDETDPDDPVVEVELSLDP